VFVIIFFEVFSEGVLYFIIDIKCIPDVLEVCGDVVIVRSFFVTETLIVEEFCDDL